MIAQKKASEPGQSSESRAKKADAPKVEDVPAAQQANPLWHSIATTTSGSSAGAPPGDGGGHTKVQPRPIAGVSGLVQRPCAECEQEQEQDSTPIQRQMGFAQAGAADEPEDNELHLKLMQPKSALLVQRMCAECEEELNGSAPNVQTQLTIGAADDEYEREADRVAEKVMRMPASGAPDSPRTDDDISKPDANNHHYLRCSSLEEKGDDEQQVQAKPNIAQPGKPSTNVQDVVSSPGSGAPLMANLRNRVEPVLGHDLSNVRVHSDSRARQAADDIHARAFTHKNNVYLGSGQSSSDTALMAHELTHVVQQGAAIKRKAASDEALDVILRSNDLAQEGGVESATVPAKNTKTAALSSESEAQSQLGNEAQSDENSGEAGASTERIDTSEKSRHGPVNEAAEVVTVETNGENAAPQNLSLAQTQDQAPDLQAAWYNVDIPFTDYQFDPSIRGVKNAVGIARDTVVDAAESVRDTAVNAFQWVYDKIEGWVNSGIEWLNDKFDTIKDFAKTAFDTVKNGLKGLTGLITSPASLLTGGLVSMNAALIKSAWNLLKTGANAVWKGTKAVIDGVLKTGSDLWETASGYVGKLFGKIEGVINGWAFSQLPDFLQRGARGLYNRIKSLWTRINKFITDLLKRLRKFCADLLNAIESFVQQVVSYGIDAVIAAVEKIKQGWDLVKEVAADPEGYIRPYINQLASKINAETPPKAVQIGDTNLQQANAPDVADGTLVQRTPKSGAPSRSTATFGEVYDGFVAAISEAWSKLDIGQMLWETVVNMFWPPATIRAIGHEFYELWSKDWANAAGNLFTPRAPWNDFLGFFHDLWSNFLILLDFPLALWRRLNAVLMLLMGYVALIAMIVGAVVGAVGGEGVGAIPGALAGLAFVAPIGEALLASYFAAEILTVQKTLVELLTARQTQTQKNNDYHQLAGSLIGMAIAAVLVAIMWLLAEFLSAVARAVKARRAPEAAEPARMPAEERPAEARPAEESPRPVEETPPEPALSGRRPASPERAVVDDAGNLTSYGEWYYERPGSYRTNTKGEVWERAASESPDGVVRDPISGEEIASDAWRMEEKPGHDFRSRQQAAAERGAGRKEFMDDYNNPDHYRPREPRSSSAEFSGPRPSSPEQAVLDIEGNLTDYGRWYYERPSGFREGIRETVWQEAQANSVDGVVRDPLTLEEMSPTEPWDMGHRPGYEFRKHRASAAERGIGRETFLEEHNTPSHYRPEKPSSNRGHQGEAPDDVYHGP